MVQVIINFCHRHHKHTYFKAVKIDIFSKSQQDVKFFDHSVVYIPVYGRGLAMYRKPIIPTVIKIADNSAQVPIRVKKKTQQQSQTLSELACLRG